MLQTMNKFIALAFVSYATSACCMAQVSALPKEGGTTEIVSSSSSEQCAIDKAQQRAQEVCVGKRYVVVTTNTKYQGADPNAKLAVGLLSGGRTNGSGQDDYRTDMIVKCE
jgi:hypothetical protein